MSKYLPTYAIKNAKYMFELTEEALPYYDKLYALMKVLGADKRTEQNR